MRLLRGEGGAYARDKNTSARLSAKKAGGAYARGGAYLQDTTVLVTLLYQRVGRLADAQYMQYLSKSLTTSPQIR